MMRCIRTIYKKYPLLLTGGLILFICFLAYGQITNMHFFREDYLTIYSIQHPDAPKVKLGFGVFKYPDGYEVTLFIPFYHLFGLNPHGYYFIEVILYFFASLAVYFLAKTLTANKNMALGSALIFASGFVGSESLYRVAIGWQNILAATFISLSAALYFKYVKTPRRKYYLLALAVYLFTSDFSFYRAHGIILLILSIEIIFNFKLWQSILRMVPFILSYWYFYVYSISTMMDQGSKLPNFIQKILTPGNFHLLLTPFKTLENLFIPDKFNLPLIIFMAMLICTLIWKRSKLLIFCLIFAMANYIVYFYTSPENPQETTHRYLTVSFVGVAIFWGIFLNKVFKGFYGYFLSCIFIIILNLILVRSEQIDILKNRSQPSALFWQSFQKEVQNLPKNSVIYIDSKNDGVSKPIRDAALGAGSMSATTSFAVYYGLQWEDIYLAENFPEILKLVETGKVSKDNIYTFFYSKKDGLLNTTDQVKTTLFKENKVEMVDNPNNLNIPYYSPVLLKFSNYFKIDFSNINNSNQSGVNLSKYLDFLLSRKYYWDTVSASATTEAEYAEIGKIKDQDITTSWKGDDLIWQKNQKEEVILTLGANKSVGGIRLVPGALTRVPIKYLYECSSDKINWSKLKNVERNVTKVETIIDKFDSSSCAFIKLTVYNTVSNGPPQISEIEVLESQFIDLDIVKAEEIEQDPFIFINSTNDVTILSEYLAKNGIDGKICIYTNKYKETEPQCKKYKFKQYSSGEFFIDQGGTVINKIEFQIPERVKLTTNNVILEYQDFVQLQNRGYIAKHTN